jgi:NAD(P)-dependent dehydrogenase (short-subunit alcohol dehydrogenase family)
MLVSKPWQQGATAMTAIVVTGAAQGIGRAVAELLSKEGHPLFVVDTDAEGNGGGRTGAARRCRDRPGLRRRRCHRRGRDASGGASLGGCRGLSHNAGIQRYATALSTERETWDEVVAVNLTPAYLLSRALRSG